MFSSLLKESNHALVLVKLGFRFLFFYNLTLVWNIDPTGEMENAVSGYLGQPTVVLV
jgi:hypothetical protein